MNDATPRKFTGSLLERAAARYAFEPPKVQHGPPSMPPPVPRPAPPAARIAQPVPAAPVPAWSDHALPQPAPVPEPAFAAPPRDFTPTRHVSIDRDALLAGGFILPAAPVTGLAEEFRIIKRPLLAAADAGDDPRARRILVCSPQPGDGKTFTALNLALSIAAEKDREVLLVDADLAKPAVARLLGLDPGPGLLDALADPTRDIATTVIGTDIPQLSVLTTGTHTHDDTELLTSPRTRALLDSLTATNPRRIVIFDSPPALAASAASSLATQVGQIVMVVRADRTPESELREAVALLEGPARINLLLNGASFAPGGKRFGAYYGNGASA